MPIKAIFPRKLSKYVRIHQDIIKAVRAEGGHSITEIVNTILAKKYAPHLLAEFEDFKAKPLTFPHRITKNRFSRD